MKIIQKIKKYKMTIIISLIAAILCFILVIKGVNVIYAAIMSVLGIGTALFKEKEKTDTKYKNKIKTIKTEREKKLNETKNLGGDNLLNKFNETYSKRKSQKN